MVYPLKLYFKHRVTLILITASLCVNAAIWVWLITQFPPTGEPVFLHYNVLFGVDEIGDWPKIFFVPLLGLALLFANAMLGWLSWDRDAYMAHLLNFIGLLCQVFLLISAVLLVALNV
ncbi:MAG: hypothetical protein AAB408_03455 [Patescibacteria group bacterium]